MDKELKEYLEWQGIEADSLEDAKKKFPLKYTTEEQFLKDPEKRGKVTGITVGSIHTGITRIGRAYGVEFTKEEAKDKTPEDLADMIFKKHVDQYEAKLAELKKVAEAGSDDKVKELQTRYEKLEAKSKEYKSAWETSVAEMENKTRENEEKLKGVKLEFVKNNVWGSVKFDPTVDPLKRKGFEATIKENFVIDLDENDKPVIRNKDGKQIINPQKHDQFLSVEEVLQLEADKAGLTAKNKDAGRPAPIFGAPTNHPKGNEPIQGRKMAARAKV